MQPTASEKEIVSIPEYQRNYAAWGRNKTFELLARGDLETVRIMGRRYVKLASHRRLIAEGTR